MFDVHTQDLVAGSRPDSGITVSPYSQHWQIPSMARVGGIHICVQPTANETHTDMPELDLWEYYLQYKLADAMGKSQGANWFCDDCHFDDLDCGCDAIELPQPLHVRKSDGWVRVIKTYAGRSKRFWTFAPPKNVGEFPDGKVYYRRLRSECKSKNTVRDCAIRWFRSEDCDELCTMLGLEPGYVRRMAGL